MKLPAIPQPPVASPVTTVCNNLVASGLEVPRTLDHPRPTTPPQPQLSPRMMAAWARAYGIPLSTKLQGELAILDKQETMVLLPPLSDRTDQLDPAEIVTLRQTWQLEHKVINRMLISGSAQHVSNSACMILNELDIDLTPHNDPLAIFDSLKSLTRWMTSAHLRTLLVILYRLQCTGPNFPNGSGTYRFVLDYIKNYLDTDDYLFLSSFGS